MKTLRFLALLIVFNAYSQKQDIAPIKPIRSYHIKEIRENGKLLYLYNDNDNSRLNGQYNITFFFLDNKKKDSLIMDNGVEKKPLLYDTKFSKYSRSHISKTGTFNKGYKNNLWKTTYKNKLVQTINHNNGLVIGRYRVYNTKGEILYKTTFGTQGNGKFKDYYYASGILKEEGSYENGKKEGEWCDYDQQGNIVKTTHYKNGMPLIE